MRKMIGLLLFMPLCATLALMLLPNPLAHAVAADARERRFEFEYTAMVRDVPAGAKKLELWIPIPHDTPFQKITGVQIQSPYPYKIQTAQFGNRVLHINVANPPQANFAVVMRFDVVRREHVQERLRQANFSPAKEVVDAANAKTDLEKARAIYNHIVATVKYDKTGNGWGRGDIYYACDERRGNCTDFHAIFIGYARALGIPARFSIGFPLPADAGAGQISGYHCWAEFYLKGVGWVPVDASEAAKDPSRREYFFGAHDENRVEFTRGRDLVLNPRQQGEALNYFIYPYAEIDGKPFASVDKKFSYRDQTSPTPTGGGD